MDLNGTNKTYDFDEVVAEIEKTGISSVCRTINKFRKILDDKNVSSKNKDLVVLIKEDTSLALTVLKVANSPLFRAPSRQPIDDLSNAINLIGWDAIYKIGITLTVKGLVNTCKVRVFAEWIIMRSIQVATVSELFLEPLKSENNELTNINSIYAYGLLHDIGVIGLLQTIDNYQQDVMQIKLTDDKKNWSDAENSLYGFNHNMIGEQIILRNQLPVSISTIAKHHHSQSYLPRHSEACKITALVRLAQAALVDEHKFSEHEAFCNFNSIADGKDLIRDYDDFSDSLKNEFEQNLNLTADIYNEVKSKKLTNEFIKKISQGFGN